MADGTADAGPDATLDAFGWTPELALAHAPHAELGREPARVVAEDRGRYQVVGEAGELPAAISGRFRHEATNDPRSMNATTVTGFAPVTSSWGKNRTSTTRITAVWIRP